MKNKTLRADLLLLLGAAIWGFAFAFQRMGGEYLQAFTFGAVRFLLGAVSLLPLILILDKKKGKAAQPWPVKEGIIIGVILAIATFLQQKGLETTQAGKSSFVTALYIVLVPLIGMLFGRRTGKKIWLAIVLAVGGLYLICVDGISGLETGDLLTLGCAVMFAFQILSVDHYAAHADALKLSFVEFATCGVVSLVPALLFEQSTFTLANIEKALVPILYAGLMSVGVAYTLQTVAQKDAPPAHAAIFMSLESVFGAVGGALILHERMETPAMIGCALMLCAVLLAQDIPLFGRKHV